MSSLAFLVTTTAVAVLVSAYREIHDAGKIASVASSDTSTLTTYGERTSYELWEALLQMPITVLVGVFVLLCTWSLISLLCYHAVLIVSAETTNERVRGVYFATPNPSHRGCCSNIFHFCCGPIPPSRLPRDFSTEVKTTEFCGSTATTTIITDCHNIVRRPETPWMGLLESERDISGTGTIHEILVDDM